MQASNIVYTVVDEANRCTYVILAPGVLTDGEIYRPIRREFLRHGGRPLARGETLTLTVTSSGGSISSVTEPEPQQGPLSPTATHPNEQERFISPPASLG